MAGRLAEEKNERKTGEKTKKKEAGLAGRPAGEKNKRQKQRKRRPGWPAGRPKRKIKEK